MAGSTILEKTTCYHCGDNCNIVSIAIDEKSFCCNGCKGVYKILSENKLCSYYSYNDHPGASRERTDKRFDYLSEPTIAGQLIDYTDTEKTIVTFYIPQIHCSSCLWLLEQLNKIIEIGV